MLIALAKFLTPQMKLSELTLRDLQRDQGIIQRFPNHNHAIFYQITPVALHAFFLTGR